MCSSAIAARADLDTMCAGTDYELVVGQDPQAFQRGETFEARLKENGYGALIELLREKAGFPTNCARQSCLVIGGPSRERDHWTRCTQRHSSRCSGERSCVRVHPTASFRVS